MQERPVPDQPTNPLAGALDQIRERIWRGQLVPANGKRNNPHSRAHTKRYADGRNRAQSPAQSNQRKCSGPSEHAVMRGLGVIGPAPKTKARHRWQAEQRRAKQKAGQDKAR